MPTSNGSYGFKAVQDFVHAQYGRGRPTVFPHLRVTKSRGVNRRFLSKLVSPLHFNGLTLNPLHPQAIKTPAGSMLPGTSSAPGAGDEPGGGGLHGGAGARPGRPRRGGGGLRCEVGFRVVFEPESAHCRNQQVVYTSGSAMLEQGVGPTLVLGRWLPLALGSL